MDRTSVLTNLTLAAAEQYKLLGVDGESTAQILCDGYAALAEVWRLPAENVRAFKETVDAARTAACADTATGIQGDFQIPTDADDIVCALVFTAEGQEPATAERILSTARYLASYWAASVPL